MYLLAWPGVCGAEHARPDAESIINDFIYQNEFYNNAMKGTRQSVLFFITDMVKGKEKVQSNRTAPSRVSMPLYCGTQKRSMNRAHLHMNM